MDFFFWILPCRICSAVGYGLPGKQFALHLRRSQEDKQNGLGSHGGQCLGHVKIIVLNSDSDNSLKKKKKNTKGKGSKREKKRTNIIFSFFSVEISNKNWKIRSSCLKPSHQRYPRIGIKNLMMLIMMNTMILW